MITGYILLVSAISVVCTLAIRRRDIFTEAVDDSLATEQARHRTTAASIA